jgi:hypothetical protein
VQATGNERLAPLLRARIDAEPDIAREDRPVALELVRRLEAGLPIEGRLSPGHTGVPHANFSTADIERAVTGRPAERLAAG